ncbi:MAG: exopolyphosphatase, partial [Pirellulaceae bacterium]|nr:exopolyphosphatase [Pirellulaceae bacterium]
MKTETNAVIRTVAVVDIGATSIRMAIAEIDDQGASRTLERLSQPVNLGTDTFTADQISKETIEECVQVLSSYRKLIEEYDISDPNQIRVVATSAVREARNRLAFQDRIYIATGFEVETLDEAEVTRVAYMGIEPFFRTEPWLAAARTLVV